MIDIQYRVRSAFFSVIHNLITYNGSYVPVVDDISTLDDDANLYIILSSQTAVETSNFTHFVHDCTITIDIVHKTMYAVTKDVVDNIAQQILDRVYSGVTDNTLYDSQLQYVNLRKENDNYLTIELSSGAIVRRILVFNLLVHEK